MHVISTLKRQSYSNLCHYNFIVFEAQHYYLINYVNAITIVSYIEIRHYVYLGLLLGVLRLTYFLMDTFAPASLPLSTL